MFMLQTPSKKAPVIDLKKLKNSRDTQVEKHLPSNLQKAKSFLIEETFLMVKKNFSEKDKV
jgi:hypothetical protein